MKPKSMKTILLAALMAPGALFAQTTATTTPVGYTTQAIPPSSFTFLGLTTLAPTISSGVLTASSSTSVTAGVVDFAALLQSGETYILELEDGTISEVKTWNASGVLFTSENISSLVTNNVTKYKLRKAQTISDVFGATNSSGLTATAESFETADQIFVPTATGTVIVYYFNDGSPDSGWYTSEGASAASLPIVYSDGFYVKRVAGSNINLVVSGEVKTKPTSGVLTPGWNILSAVTPAGSTLESSNLQNSIVKSPDGDFLTVDNVYIPDGSSFIITYYYDDGSPDTGWYTTGGAPAGDTPVDGAFLIFSRRASNAPYTFNVPTSYSSL